MATDTGRKDDDEGHEDADDEGLDFTDEEDEDEDDGDESGKDKKPATVTREEFERVIRQRDRAKALLRSATGKTKAAKGKGDDEKEDKADASELTEMQSRFVRSEAKTAFLAAGLQLPADAEGRTKILRRVTRMLDMDDLEIDGDEIIGLDDQVDEIRAALPQLFKQADDDQDDRKRRRVRLNGAGNGRSNGTGRGEGGDSADRLAELINKTQRR